MSMYAFYTYIRPILTHVLGYTTSEMEILLAVLGVASIIGNFGAGWVSKQFGVRSIVILEGICVVAAALLAPTSRIGWIGVILLCILCLILVMPSVVLQAMFLSIAVRDYPQAVNLSSTLDPLCCNIGVTFGSLFASLMIRSLPLRNLGYLSALFAVLACVSAFILTRSVARLNRKRQSD
jgi:DHA1 family inner membrane transport protein